MSQTIMYSVKYLVGVRTISSKNGTFAQSCFYRHLSFVYNHHIIKTSNIFRLCNCRYSCFKNRSSNFPKKANSRSLLNENVRHVSNVFSPQSGKSALLSNFTDNKPLPKIVHLRHCSTQSAVAHTQFGWFKSLSESTPVSYAQDFFMYVHDTTHLPWWASIVLTTVILRSFITVPLALYQNYILAKVENLQLEMPDIVKDIKGEMAFAVKKYKWTEQHARVIYTRSVKKKWNELIIRENCHPFKASILVWVQLPMWICFSTALRNLVYMLPETNLAAQIIFMEMTVGGFGWIPNLTIPDASLILPVAFGLINLANIELQSMTRVRKPTKFHRILTNTFRVVSIVMIPVAACVPSCLNLYWTTSSLFGLGQSLLLLSPKIKQISGIPKSASQLDQPYSHVLEKIRERAAWLYKPLMSK